MNKKVLVVDDSGTIRREVTKVLADAGFDVCEAADGVEGIEVLDRENPGLVLCDVNMPRMNGIAMLQEVKRTGKHPSTPVLMLTTEGQPRLIREAKEAGAKGWIVKPFSPVQLVAAVTKFVGP